jgi:hypothetical protein
MSPLVASAMDHMVRDRHQRLRNTRPRRPRRHRLRDWLDRYVPAGARSPVSGRDVVVPQDLIEP